MYILQLNRKEIIMKNSKTTIKELTARYSAILRKCAFLNAVILAGFAFATPALADTPRTPFMASDDQVLSDLYDSYTPNTDSTKAGVVAIGYDIKNVSVADNTVFRNNGTQKSAGGAIKALNGFKIGNNVQFLENKATESAWGGGALYIKLADKTNPSESTSVSIGKNNVFSKNEGNKLGGAIALEYGDVTIANGTTFSDNKANEGGAIAMWEDPNNDHGSLPAPTLKLTGVSFNNNHAEANGGAIFNDNGKELAIGEGTTFTGNTAVRAGGAIYNAGYISKVSNVIFEDNTSNLRAGAIDNIHEDGKGPGIIEAIENSKFIGNKALPSQGGAIRNQGTIKSIKNTLFEANAAGNGGAINNGSAGRIDEITNSQFIGNESSGWGGAITNANVITIEQSEFNSNSAAGGVGGAIANNETGSITITNTQFVNNKSSTTGGAINNRIDKIDKDKRGKISLKGTNIFSGNKAGGILNDIHNDGELSVDGTLTLDGGITGNGDITFAAGSTLNATLQTTTILANSLTTNGATLNLTLANGVADGSYDFVTANTIDQAFTLTENSLYNITMEDNGQITLARKATDEISSGAGLSDSEAAAIIAASQSTVNNPVLEQMTAALQSGDTDTAKTLAGAINPTEDAAKQVAANTNAIGAAVLNRLFASGPAMVARPAQNGRSGGDIKSKLAPWVQGLYTKTHNTQAVGFDAYSRGFAFGVDSDITNAVKVGIGYAYTATDIKSNRKTQVYGDNYFVYGQYKPHNWYVNGMFSYGHANYKEATVATTAKYNVDNYAAQIMTGYDYGIANNYAGVRYNYIDTETYNNGVADIKTKNAQIGTLVIGTKISKDFKPARGVLLTPEFRLAGTYDVKSDNNSATVAVMGASSTYSVTGERLSRGAIEAGVGLTANIKRLELSLGYDTSVRKHNFSQGGMVKAKYNF